MYTRFAGIGKLSEYGTKGKERVVTKATDINRYGKRFERIETEAIETLISRPNLRQYRSQMI